LSNKYTLKYYLVLPAGSVLPINAFISDVDADPFNSDSLSHFLDATQTKYLLIYYRECKAQW